MSTPFTPPPRFAVVSGISRLTKTHRVVALRLIGEGKLKPVGHVVGSSGNPRPVFDLTSAVDIVRAAVRSRLTPISPRELQAALAAPIPTTSTQEARA